MVAYQSQTAFFCFVIRPGEERVWSGSNTHTACSQGKKVQYYLNSHMRTLQSCALQAYMRTRSLITSLACSTLDGGNITL